MNKVIYKRYKTCSFCGDKILKNIECYSLTEKINFCLRDGKILIESGLFEWAK